MKKKIAAITSVVSLLLSFSPVLAVPPILSTGELQTPGTSRTLNLPSSADNAHVISLGTSVDPQTGKIVEGLAFIHYKKEFSHKPQHPGNGGTTTNKCYSYLASGAKWKTVEPWVANTANSAGLDINFVFDTTTASISKWEDAADGVIGSGPGADILGNGSTTANTLAADNQSPDGTNEVLFADVSSNGAIAVTIVWGRFSGPTFARELVEWDMVFDDVDFSWSAAGEVGKMDFENIAIHEIGHANGMGHPDDSCIDETMYRFASLGETKKRDLATGDISGINNLY